MDDQQHRDCRRLDLHRADRVPALFPGRAVDAIQTDEALFILKTNAASSNETPCLRWFLRFFDSSHS